MPFDPKLIQAEEPPLAANGDLNLPPDLAVLAEQLRDDAAHLAAAYPAITNTPTRSVSEGIFTQARSASEGPSRRHLQIRRPTALIASTIAATLAVLLAGLAVFWHAPEATLQKHSPTPSTHFITSAAHSDTTISLTELSSPELEAFLDLMERSPDNALRVSF
jgi:hypothetical protein